MSDAKVQIRIKWLELMLEQTWQIPCCAQNMIDRVRKCVYESDSFTLCPNISKWAINATWNAKRNTVHINLIVAKCMHTQLDRLAFSVLNQYLCSECYWFKWNKWSKKGVFFFTCLKLQRYFWCVLRVSSPRITSQSSIYLIVFAPSS